jgi:hypothetical protein
MATGRRGGASFAAQITDMARGISNIARQATRIGVEEQQIKARLSKGDSTRIAWYFIS